MPGCEDIDPMTGSGSVVRPQEGRTPSPTDVGPHQNLGWSTRSRCASSSPRSPTPYSWVAAIAFRSAPRVAAEISASIALHVPALHPGVASRRVGYGLIRTSHRRRSGQVGGYRGSSTEDDDVDRIDVARGRRRSPRYVGNAVYSRGSITISGVLFADAMSRLIAISPSSSAAHRPGGVPLQGVTLIDCRLAAAISLTHGKDGVERTIRPGCRDFGRIVSIDAGSSPGRRGRRSAGRWAGSIAAVLLSVAART